jgi:hypothetical protein
VLYSTSTDNLFNKENEMNYRTLFLLNSLLTFLLGAAFLVVPSLAIGQFGVDNYASTKMVAQFFGTALLAVGLLLWFAKDVTDAAVQRGMSIALLVAALAGLVVTVIGTAGGILRSNEWIAILAYVLFGLGYAFLVFMKPRLNT